MSEPSVSGSVGQVTSPSLAPSRLVTSGLSVFIRTYSSIVALAALVIFNILFTPNFLTAGSFNANMTKWATIVIVAVGMTFVIATGGIDLSVGSPRAIAGVLAPLFLLKWQSIRHSGSWTCTGDRGAAAGDDAAGVRSTARS